jgi:hypothetical protein
MDEDPKSLIERNQRLLLYSEGQATEETIEELMERNRRLVDIAEKTRKSEELLEALPQGHGSGLDADMVDGFHAHELIVKGQSAGGGGGSGEGIIKHGNEWHTKQFVEVRSDEATIIAGTEYVDVPHGSDSVPDSNKIQVSAKDDLAGRSFWHDTVGETTFRLHISIVDLEQNHVFGWMIVLPGAE